MASSTFCPRRGCCLLRAALGSDPSERLRAPARMGTQSGGGDSSDERRVIRMYICSKVTFHRFIIWNFVAVRSRPASSSSSPSGGANQTTPAFFGPQSSRSRASVWATTTATTLSELGPAAIMSPRPAPMGRCSSRGRLTILATPDEFLEGRPLVARRRQTLNLIVNVVVVVIVRLQLDEMPTPAPTGTTSEPAAIITTAASRADQEQQVSACGLAAAN